VFFIAAISLAASLHFQPAEDRPGAVTFVVIYAVALVLAVVVVAAHLMARQQKGVVVQTTRHSSFTSNVKLPGVSWSYQRHTTIGSPGLKVETGNQAEDAPEDDSSDSENPSLN